MINIRVGRENGEAAGDHAVNGLLQKVVLLLGIEVGFQAREVERSADEDIGIVPLRAPESSSKKTCDRS